MTQETSKHGFSRARRLDGPHAYAAVFSYRCSVGGALFRIYARPNGMGAPRLGVVVSKRAIPQAVARNYCKRLAREVFRSVNADLGGIDIVVRPRTAVKRADSHAARTEIRMLFQRAQRQLREREGASVR